MLPGRLFDWLIPSRPVAVRENLLPAAPTLTGAFSLANTVAAGHPLGYASERVVRGARLIADAKPAVKVSRLYRVIVLVNWRGRQSRALTLSWRGSSAFSRLQTALAALHSFPRGVGVFAEVAAVPPLLENVELPWFALAERDERLFAPGMRAYLQLAYADAQNEGELLLVDWRRPPPGEDRIPRPVEMLLYAGRHEGRVFYAAVLNAARIAGWGSVA